MMPEMSGMDLYQEVARLAPEQAERMVFLTGGAFTPLARAFLDRVKNRCVEKPFTPRELRELVQVRLAEGPTETLGAS
jgi:CheY-like chemotaxis protein